MNQKQAIFLYGLVTGLVFSVFVSFILYVSFNQRAYANPDMFALMDQAIHEAKPSVVGVIRINQAKDKGTGSGVVYKLTKDEAYIVTNQHVIKGADEIEVAFPDEVRVKATLVGEDLLTDLAVIKIPRGNLTKVLEFSKAINVRVGEFVFAIGNPLGLDLYGSTTLGIVSSEQRLIPIDIDKNGEDDFIATVIQTDAAINPGNSGGALVNLAGKLIGINSMKIAGTQIEGIGFSIPAHIVQLIINDLEQFQMVRRPYLGMHLKSVEKISEKDKEKWQLTEIEKGVYVNDVISNSPSDLAGLKINDIITQVNGKEIEDVTDFRYELYEYQLGDTIIFCIIRNKAVQEIKVILQTKGS